ncbi:MAG: redoxin domain-containing protein, partial [Bacteroidales bacterium]|nr:redoxin domain-containing protein [Bacteroidales bacterium]
MKSVLYVAAAVLSLLATPTVFAALAVGDRAPGFSVEGAQGGAILTVDLSELLEEGPVVIYFFPSAFADPAASREFADNIAEFRAAGASVVGMSRDSIDTLARFSTDVCAGMFPVASA